MRKVEIEDKVEVSEEDLEDLLNQANKYMEELREVLKDIKVPVERTVSPQVIEAIQHIFGTTYLTRGGNSYVTFDMFLDCLNITRNVGRATAAEFA